MKNSLSEDILEYFLLIDSNRWMFPPQVMYIFIILGFVLSLTFIGGEKKDEVKHIDMTIEVDTTQYKAEEVNLDIDTISRKGNFWVGKDINIPSGVIFRKDHAGSGTKLEDQTDNYITVRGFNGQLKIVRDIDVDLYLNLEKGDTIK